MCIKNSYSERFRNKGEYEKANRIMMEPTRQFQKEAPEGKYTTPKQPEPLPFPVRRFLETFLGRSPCAECDKVDFSKLPARVIECLPDAANALLATGLITKNDVISKNDLRTLLNNGQWDKMSRWLQFDVFFKNLSIVDMQQIDDNVREDLNIQRRKTWGIKTKTELKEAFVNKKLKGGI